MLRSLALIFFVLPLLASAQSPETVLATAKGRTFTSADLSPEGRTVFVGQRKSLDDTRTHLLGQMIANGLLDLEAKASGSTPARLIDAAKARVAEPTSAQVQAVYDANQAALGNRPLAEVRAQIVNYLRREPEDKAIAAYVASLQTKYKYTVGKNVNTGDLSPLDVLATFGSRQITAGEYEAKNKLALNEHLHHTYENLRSDLEVAVLNSLIGEEAKAMNVEPSTIIATEITNKLREFSDEEREGLETALMKRLFAKYQVKILLKEPEAIAQSVSAAGEPSFGSPSAPVTIVMFSDFQCPACARTHPVLKRVMQEYAGKVRLVIRDFPLEGVHENAFNGALAANAAAKQGKYAEYVERLYSNQESLDKASLLRFAREIGLNVKQFEIDFSDAAAAAEIREDQNAGELLGVGSTPTVFVNGVKVHNLSASAFRRAIDRALGN